MTVFYFIYCGSLNASELRTDVHRERTSVQKCKCMTVDVYQ